MDNKSLKGSLVFPNWMSFSFVKSTETPSFDQQSVGKFSDLGLPGYLSRYGPLAWLNLIFIHFSIVRLPYKAMLVDIEPEAK